MRIKTVVDYVNFRLDPIANSIAKATFDVINEGKVRTADMGGKLFPGQGKNEELSLIYNLQVLLQLQISQHPSSSICEV